MAASRRSGGRGRGSGHSRNGFLNPAKAGGWLWWGGEGRGGDNRSGSLCSATLIVCQCWHMYRYNIHCIYHAPSLSLKLPGSGQTSSWSCKCVSEEGGGGRKGRCHSHCSIHVRTYVAESLSTYMADLGTRGANDGALEPIAIVYDVQHKLQACACIII